MTKNIKINRINNIKIKNKGRGMSKMHKITKIRHADILFYLY